MTTPTEPSSNKPYAIATCAKEEAPVIIEGAIALVNKDKAIGQLSTIMCYTKDLRPSSLIQIIELTSSMLFPTGFTRSSKKSTSRDFAT